MMTVEEIEEAMEDYHEKSCMLPTPENAEEFRAAMKMLHDLPARKAAEQLAEKFPNNDATRLWNRGMVSPHEFYVKLLEDDSTAWTMALNWA